MQIQMMPTPGSKQGLYPDFIGKRSVFAGIGTGPANYTTQVGDPVSLNISPFYIDSMWGGLDTSGTYKVEFYSKSTGTRQQWFARFIVANTGAEYAGGTALATLVWNGIAGLGGQF